jgi:excisionase family DNA binding protein
MLRLVTLRCMTTKSCPQSSEHMLTSEFAEALRIHVESVRRFIRQGRLNAIKIGRHWRILRSELERIQREGGV